MYLLVEVTLCFIFLTISAVRVHGVTVRVHGVSRLLHCSALVVCFGCPTRGGETGSPPPKSIDYFCVSRGFFGGRGIARPPSSSHPRCVHQHCRRVLRRRKDWHLSLPPHNVEVFFGGGGIGPPPHNVGTFGDYLLAVQCRLFVGKIKLGC